jgi:hypothetical protein
MQERYFCEYPGVSIGLAMEAAVNVIRAVERKVASLGLCDRVIPVSRPRARSPRLMPD